MNPDIARRAAEIDSHPNNRRFMKATPRDCTQANLNGYAWKEVKKTDWPSYLAVIIAVVMVSLWMLVR